MEKILTLLEKEFGEKYAKLKLFEVCLDKQQFVCTITFLYPDGQFEPDEEKRTQLCDFLKPTLNLKSELKVKFKKSFFTQSLIVSDVLNFLKSTHKSVSFGYTKDNIKCEIGTFSVDVNILCGDDALSLFEHDKLCDKIKKMLEKNYIASFNVKLVVDHEKVISKDEFLDNVVVTYQPIPPKKRYKVELIKKIIGDYITNDPEIFKDITSPKENVILAGEIKTIEKKFYIRKKDKDSENPPNHVYYVMTVKEFDNTFPLTYFCPHSNEKKIDKYLKEGVEIVAMGSVKNSMSKLCFYPKNITICKKIEGSMPKEEYVYKPNNYIKVKPLQYTDKKQINLFDKNSYDDFIKNNVIVVYDFETTGLDSEICEIIEIGACKVKNGQIVETFQSLIKPTTEISDIITNLTHIDNEMVKNAPKVDEVIKDFYLFCEGSILAGYNNTVFDNKFLQIAGNNASLNFNHEQVDVMSMAKSYLHKGPFNLGTVVKKMEIVLDGAHRALNDALATAKVMLKTHLQA